MVDNGWQEPVPYCLQVRLTTSPCCGNYHWVIAKYRKEGERGPGKKRWVILAEGNSPTYQMAIEEGEKQSHLFLMEESNGRRTERKNGFGECSLVNSCAGQ